RTIRRLRVALAVVSLLLVAAVVGGIVVLQGWRDADQQRDISDAQKNEALDRVRTVEAQAKADDVQKNEALDRIRTVEAQAKADQQQLTPDQQGKALQQLRLAEARALAANAWNQLSVDP